MADWLILRSVVSYVLYDTGRFDVWFVGKQSHGLGMYVQIKNAADGFQRYFTVIVYRLFNLLSGTTSYQNLHYFSPQNIFLLL